MMGVVALYNNVVVHLYLCYVPNMSHNEKHKSLHEFVAPSVISCMYTSARGIPQQEPVSVPHEKPRNESNTSVAGCSVESYGRSHK
jgi:hypothetical protein